MELTRRDALVALGATGLASAGVGAGVVALDGRDGEDETGNEGALSTTARETLVGAATVLYPSDVDGVASFVERYSLGRTRGRSDYRAGVEAATATLDEAAREWHGERFAALDASTRESTLRELGADTADPEPNGRRAGRVRYYVVDELLYAFYASPVGGGMAGIENPPGYPGGTESYREGPGTAGEESTGDGTSTAGSAGAHGTDTPGEGER
jgi:hypothetical protein